MFVGKSSLAVEGRLSVDERGGSIPNRATVGACFISYGSVSCIRQLLVILLFHFSVKLSANYES